MKKIIDRLSFIVVLAVVCIVTVKRFYREPEEEIIKQRIYIIYKNMEYKETDEKDAVPIISSDGIMWAIGATTYEKPVYVPVNKDYEIGAYSLGQHTTFFHMGEEPITLIVDYKTGEVTGVGIDYQLREPTTSGEKFIRTVLSAIGNETFSGVSELSDETIARMLLAMPDISYMCYGTEDYIPYTVTEDNRVFVTNEDMAEASSAIFGRTVDSECLGAITEYDGYEAGSSGYTRTGYSGHGKWNEVRVDNVTDDDDKFVIDYTYITYEDEEASDDRRPSEEIRYTAVFEKSGNEAYPYRVKSVKEKEENW